MKVVEVVLGSCARKLLRDCAEGEGGAKGSGGCGRLCRRRLQVVPKVVEVVLKCLRVVLKVLGDCTEIAWRLCRRW